MTLLRSASSVREYLRESPTDLGGPVVDVRQLGGGVSALVYLIVFSDGTEVVLKQALPRLQVDTHWPSDPRRIHREANAARWLRENVARSAIPEILYEDFENHLVVMEAVARPNSTWKALLLGGDVDTGIVASFAQLLASIHRQSSSGVDSLPAEMRDQSFFRALRIEPYYEYTAIQVPRCAPYLRTLVDRTLATRAALVHGDFSPKNILIHDQDMALVDHEVAHFGDPAFDIGFAMTHLVGKANALPNHRGPIRAAAKEFWDSYTSHLGHRSFYPGFEVRCSEHLIACTLARASGRSQFEYLSVDEKSAQRAAAETVIENGVRDLLAVFDALLNELEAP